MCCPDNNVRCSREELLRWVQKLTHKERAGSNLPEGLVSQGLLSSSSSSSSFNASNRPIRTKQHFHPAAVLAVDCLSEWTRSLALYAPSELFLKGELLVPLLATLDQLPPPKEKYSTW